MGNKKRLGRGMDGLFEDNSVPEKEEELAGVSEVRISLIEPNASQPRGKFDDDKLSELADNIKKHGVLQPILVRPIANGGYQIVAGERRWRAARLAGLTEIPVYIKDLDDLQTAQVALIENVQRQDLSPLEEAGAYKKLMDAYGMTQQDISEAVGKSRSVVANSLRLLSLGEMCKKLLEDGKITVGHAKMLAGIDDENKQAELGKLCEQDGLTVRELENAAAKLNKPTEEKVKDDRNSIKKERPFLYEFEAAVRNSSTVKAKARPMNNGNTKLELEFDKNTDMQKILSEIAAILSGC